MKKEKAQRLEVIKLDAGYHEKIAQLVSLSFMGDPLGSYFCGNNSRRLSQMFRIAAYMHISLGQPAWGIVDQGKLVASALVYEPEYRPRAGAMLRTLSWMILTVGPGSVWRHLQHFHAVKNYFLSEPHHTLQMLAVHPSYQGQGLAKLLLEKIQAISGEHHLSKGVFLETNKVENVQLYLHMGYRLVKSLDLKGYKSFLMFRENK